MAYTIDFESHALEDLKSLRKADQVKILEAIQLHLTHEPTRPPYRLRVDEFRVYYDVLAEQMLVIIYGIIDKEHSLA